MYKPNTKKVTVTYISWFNSFTLYLQEHVMYEHYAFDYEPVGIYNSRAITCQLFNRRQSSMVLPH